MSKLLLGILLITAKVISNDIPWHETFTDWMVESNLIVVVKSPSHVWLFKTPWMAACQASLSLPISWSLASLIVSNYTLLLWIHVVLCFSRWHCLQIRRKYFLKTTHKWFRNQWMYRKLVWISNLKTIFNSQAKYKTRGFLFYSKLAMSGK